MQYTHPVTIHDMKLLLKALKIYCLTNQNPDLNSARIVYNVLIYLVNFTQHNKSVVTQHYLNHIFNWTELFSSLKDSFRKRVPMNREKSR